MKITNPVAEQEARRLAHDFEQHVLGVLSTALVPEKTRRQFLRDAHTNLGEAGGKDWSGLVKYEHVALTCDSRDLPDDITRTALSEFSMIGTADLGSQFTLAAIVAAQRSRRDELVERAGKFAGGRLRRLKSRRKRRAEWAEHLADALGSLDGLPATGTVFDDTFRALLHTAGVARTIDGYTPVDSGEAEALGTLAAVDLGEEYLPEQIKRRAADNAAALRERWETILVWTHEATHDENGDASEGFELGPRKRFRAAIEAKKVRAARHAAAQEAERRRVEAQRREARQRYSLAEHERKKLEAAERRRRAREELRRRPRVEPDADKKDEKRDAWEPEF